MEKQNHQDHVALEECRDLLKTYQRLKQPCRDAGSPIPTSAVLPTLQTENIVIVSISHFVNTKPEVDAIAILRYFNSVKSPAEPGMGLPTNQGCCSPQKV